MFRLTEVEIALCVERLTGPLEAVVAASVARGAVSSVPVHRAVLGVSGAVLGDVAGVARHSARSSVRPQLTGGEVAAGPRGALSRGRQPTGAGVATGICALLQKK